MSITNTRSQRPLSRLLLPTLAVVGTMALAATGLGPWWVAVVTTLGVVVVESDRQIKARYRAGEAYLSACRREDPGPAHADPPADPPSDTTEGPPTPIKIGKPPGSR